MLRKLTLVLIVLLIAGLLPGAAPARAQAPIVSDNPFVTLFPELATMPAPAWVREGLRISYTAASAAAYQGPDEPAPAGGGLLQIDVVAKDTRTIALSTRFLLDAGDGTVQPSLTVGETSMPGAGPFWVNPAIFADAERAANEDLAVNRGPGTYGGRQYQVIRFDYASGGATYAWVFEEETGMLLFHRYNMGEGGSSGFQQFVASRRLRLPWRSRAAPDWLARGQQARYEGTYTAIVAGGDPIPLPFAAESEVTRVQGKWSVNSLAAITAGQRDLPGTRVTGTAQLIDALWLPPTALDVTPRRALIDADPLTGAQVSFTRERGVIVLTEEGASWRTVLVYDDQTGMLVRSYQEKQVGIATTVIDLQLVQ